MIQTLSIKNFAIIDNLSIEFGKGLNILTGETGAGKSIIIDTIGLILGERANSSFIRKGAALCEITASFDISGTKNLKELLNGMGIPQGQEEILVAKREISSDGKSRCFLNGSPCTVAMLQQAGDILVDVHGQHEHQSLLKPEIQRNMLDAYGNLMDAVKAVKTAFEEYSEIKNLFLSLKNAEKDKTHKLDLYKFQVKEIESAKLFPGIDKQLETEYSRLNNAEKLHGFSSEIYAILYEMEGSVYERVARAKKLAENLSAVDSTVSSFINDLSKINEKTKSVADFFRDYKEKIVFNEKLLDETIARMENINKLKRKYAPTVEELIKYCENIKKQVEDLENADEKLQELEKSLNSTELKLKKASETLSAKRAACAKKLSKETEKELEELGMEKSKFFAFSAAEKDEKGDYEYKPTGIDKIEYLIAPNVGEDLKPLKNIASGGEMSRIMLAIKTVLAKADETPVLIFDEIDAGLSGPIGQIVGSKLKKLSKNHQVICITHLAQLAAFSSEHFHISKSASAGRTTVEVTKLNKEGKINEIARMLGGQNITDTTIKHAKELIKEAEMQVC